jgi:hypothetical protein
MSPEEELQRAERSRQILEDPMISEALDALENAAVAKMKLVQDDKLKLRLIDFLQATDLFRQYFTAHIETGKLARMKQLEQETWSDKAKRVVGI